MVAIATDCNAIAVIRLTSMQAAQIQALYSLLHFQDRPLHSDARTAPAAARAVKGAPADVFRMVRETLGEDAARRLEQDGVALGRQRSRRLL